MFKHINSSDVRFSSIGSRKKTGLPKQVLISFEEDLGVVPLPGLKLLKRYGDNSVMLPYERFKRMTLFFVKKMIELDDKAALDLVDVGEEESPSIDDRAADDDGTLQ